MLTEVPLISLPPLPFPFACALCCACVAMCFYNHWGIRLGLAKWEGREVGGAQLMLAGR